jgi:hypothetical protein
VKGESWWNVAKGKKTKTAQGQYSPLSSHQRQGKNFVPPFMQNQKTTLMSWRDSRVPEVLWAVLLSGNLQRELYLDIFRGIVQLAGAQGQPQIRSVRHSSIASESADAFDRVFRPALVDDRASHVLAALLLIDGLPDREHWARHLPSPDPKAHIGVLARAIARTTDHQSQESTDCRWLKVLFAVVQGTMQVNGEFVRELTEYPNFGDMRKVHPLIRSSEGALVQIDGGLAASPWVERFWIESWKKTECIRARHPNEPDVSVSQAVKDLGEVYGNTILHFRNTLATTAIDPRHDSVFGLVLYGINLAFSICNNGAHQR